MTSTLAETTSCTIPHLSREAAKECSPRRKPSELGEREASPVGTAEPAANPCHPERSLAASEASGQTQSKDPYNPHGGRGDARNFRIVIRFFDDNDSELPYDSSREAAKWESPARKSRVSTIHVTDPHRDATHA